MNHRSAAFRARAVGWALPAIVVLAACAGSDAAEQAPTTTLSVAAAITTPPDGPCISRMPGQALDEAEAVVHLSITGVCPSYVTVNAGTKVRWTNDHTAPVTVTMSAAGAASTNPLDDKNTATGGAQVFSQEIAPGGTFAHTPRQAGTYYYRISIIPTFLGTVEVK